jgi:hypothetical protein
VTGSASTTTKPRHEAAAPVLHRSAHTRVHRVTHHPPTDVPSVLRLTLPAPLPVLHSVRGGDAYALVGLASLLLVLGAGSLAVTLRQLRTEAP